MMGSMAYPKTMQYDFRDRYIQFKGSESIIKIVQAILNEEEEPTRNKHHYWSFGLDKNKTLWSAELISLGVENISELPGRKIFRFASMKDVSYVVVVQYDPTRKHVPKTEEILLTENLITAGFALGIELLDNIIFNGKRHFSFAEAVPFPNDPEFWRVRGGVFKLPGSFEVNDD